MPTDPVSPFPLPDLPRAPDSDISRMARRVLEWRDMEALTRLPDVLRDAGRDEDARHIVEMLGLEMYRQFSDGRHDPFGRVWENVADEIARVVWFDIFDWASALGVMGRAFAEPGRAAARPSSPSALNVAPFSSSSGFPDAITAAFGNLLVTLSAVPDADVPRLHAEEIHPGYEYRDAPECPDGPGWEHNPYALPAMSGDSCWMRRRPAPGAP